MGGKLVLKKEKAIGLRLAGKSYGEIMQILGLTSKGTLSYWFSDLKLSAQAKKRLKNNKIKAFERGLHHFNSERTEKIKKENARVAQRSEMSIPVLSRKALILVGAALYWGEGYKRQSNRPTPYISFGNTDPSMIKLFMRVVREALCIPEERIRGKVQIHPNVRPSKAINFWSDVTNIPKERFRTTHQVSRASKGRKPNNIQPYGTAEIIIRGRKDFFRIIGWIEGLKKNV